MYSEDKIRYLYDTHGKDPLHQLSVSHSSFLYEFCGSCRVGLVEVLLGLLDWRAGGRNGLCTQMKWNESEASIGRVLAIEVIFVYNYKSYLDFSILFCRAC